MTPGYNPTHQQAPAPFPQTKAAETEKSFTSPEPKRKSNSAPVAFSTPKEVNDPALWDEAWFANYE